jgi:predicted membrane channel-forming protein YqfA (hemolysin III family)
VLTVIASSFDSRAERATMPVVYTGMYKGERFNSISHLIGAALALAGGVVLVTYAAMDGDMHKILSYSVYGFTLFLLYFGETGLACMTSLILRVH